MTTRTPTRKRPSAPARHETAKLEAKRPRIVKQVGALVILGLLVVIAVVFALASRGGESSKAGGELVVPAHASANGVINIGRPDAPVSVSIVFDYMCPFCGRFETANSSEVDRLMTSGKARVGLRPLSFLDARSDGSDYSTRAANALATVADGAPERVWDFHRALFRQQPEEGTPGLNDKELVQIAIGAGVPEAVAGRFRDLTFAPWVASGTQKAFAAGVTATPTVLVDGAVFTGDLYSAGPLTEAVDAAAATP